MAGLDFEIDMYTERQTETERDRDRERGGSRQTD